MLKAREDGIPLKSQAVLFRASQHSAQLEIELAKRGIPFEKRGGLKFLDLAHIKDVINILRWSQNARDRIAGFRTLRLLPGIGQKSAANILGGLEGNDLASALGRASVPSATSGYWPRFHRLIKRLCANRYGWPDELERVRRWYKPHLERLFDDPDWRQSDLEQLVQMGASYGSREQFLSELAIDPVNQSVGRSGRGVDPDDDDHLILSTIHSAKGLEWRNVWILNVVEGCAPSSRSRGRAELEEERRLLYVAMTRAEDRLELMVPQQMYAFTQDFFGGGTSMSRRSTFVPASIEEYFKRRVVP